MRRDCWCGRGQVGELARICRKAQRRKMGRKFSLWQLRTIVRNTSSCASTDRYSLNSVNAAFPENYPNSPSALWMRSKTLGARMSANLSREPSEMAVPSWERM